VGTLRPWSFLRPFALASFDQGESVGDLFKVTADQLNVFDGFIVTMNDGRGPTGATLPLPVAKVQEAPVSLPNLEHMFRISKG